MACLSVEWALEIICLCFSIPRWRGWVGGFVDWKRGATWEVSFIWGKMRTIAWERAPQMALRDCSKEAVGEGQYIRLSWRGSSVQSSTYFTKGFLLDTRSWWHHEGIECFSRNEEIQGLGSWNQFLKISIWRLVPPASLEHRVPHSPPGNPLRGCWRLEAAAAQGPVSTEADGKCSCCSVQLSSVQFSRSVVSDSATPRIPGKYSWQVPICHWQPWRSLNIFKKLFWLLQEGKCRRKETVRVLLPLMQMAEGSGLDQGASSGGDDMFLDSGSILKAEPTKYAEGLDVSG